MCQTIANTLAYCSKVVALQVNISIRQISCNLASRCQYKAVVSNNYKRSSLLIKVGNNAKNCKFDQKSFIKFVFLILKICKRRTKALVFNILLPPKVFPPKIFVLIEKLSIFVLRLVDACDFALHFCRAFLECCKPPKTQWTRRSLILFKGPM